MLNLKLFIVTKIESGWSWRNEVWTKYFLSNDIEIVKAVIKERYGELDQYHYDEEESHITIEEVYPEILCLTEPN